MVVWDGGLSGTDVDEVGLISRVWAKLAWDVTTEVEWISADPFSTDTS